MSHGERNNYITEYNEILSSSTNQPNADADRQLEYYDVEIVLLVRIGCQSVHLHSEKQCHARHFILSAALVDVFNITHRYHEIFYMVFTTRGFARGLIKAALIMRHNVRPWE